MQTNTKYIKITGSYETTKEIELDQTLDLKVICDVVKIDHKSLQDGTQDIYYTCKVVEVINEI